MCKILHTVLSQDKFWREFTHFLGGCVKRITDIRYGTGESVQSGDTGDSFGTDESGEWGESGDAGDSRESNETGDAVKYMN